MKRWNVYGTVVGSAYLGQVEAETEEEAKEKGMREYGGHIRLCHQCSPSCEDAFVEDVGVEEIED